MHSNTILQYDQFSTAAGQLNPSTTGCCNTSRFMLADSIACHNQQPSSMHAPCTCADDITLRHFSRLPIYSGGTQSDSNVGVCPTTAVVSPATAAAYQSFSFGPPASYLSQFGTGMYTDVYDMSTFPMSSSMYPYTGYDSSLYGCYSPYDIAARRKNATRESTSTLKAWLAEHKKNPYPTKGEKIMLAIITKMTLTQVSTWFANARRRLKKENKMTWEPKNRFDTEDDEEFDEKEDIHIGNNLEQVLSTSIAITSGSRLHSSTCEMHVTATNLSSTMTTHSLQSRPIISTSTLNSGAERSYLDKPRIWSLADTASHGWAADSTHTHQAFTQPPFAESGLSQVHNPQSRQLVDHQESLPVLVSMASRVTSTYTPPLTPPDDGRGQVVKTVTSSLIPRPLNLSELPELGGISKWSCYSYEQRAAHNHIV